jgi:hypothetical protein
VGISYAASGVQPLLVVLSLSILIVFFHLIFDHQSHPQIQNSDQGLTSTIDQPNLKKPLTKNFQKTNKTLDKKTDGKTSKTTYRMVRISSSTFPFPASIFDAFTSTIRQCFRTTRGKKRNHLDKSVTSTV